MRQHRSSVISEEDLLLDAIAEVAAALGPIVADLAGARARFLVADEIARHDLLPRAHLVGQPTASELLEAILGALEEHACRPGASATGAHDRARRIGREMGVAGAASRTAFRRTRAEVDDDPNPTRRREGTRGLVGGVVRGVQEGVRPRVVAAPGATP